MNLSYRLKTYSTYLLLGMVTVVGVYNTLMINSSSKIVDSSVKFSKRLDEVYGVVTAKRDVANFPIWQKIHTKQSAPLKEVHKSSRFQNLNPLAAKSEDVSINQDNKNLRVEAAIMEDLELSLEQAQNPVKWKDGLKSNQISGDLKLRQGVIESLVISLPHNEGISVSSSEMSGNVFEYDLEGEIYSGMVYQEGNNTYAVNLTNGPLEGSKFLFKAKTESSELAELTEDTVVPSAPVHHEDEIAFNDQRAQFQGLAQQETHQEFESQGGVGVNQLDQFQNFEVKN